MIAPESYHRLAEVARVHLPPEESAGDPDQVGCYRLAQKIGRGSAGEVFRAIGPEGHAVAIKLLKKRARGERFVREVELLERTSTYTGVVALLDAGRCPRGPYLVLELAEGGSLRTYLRAQRWLTWQEAFGLIGTVAQTLSELHAEGIVHRDLKPENILLQEDGSPLISDFGLAKDLSDADGELTSSGFALGTIGYMAPEMLEGRREGLGPWTDIFSLGAVLYELVAGKPVFSGKTLPEVSRSIQKRNRKSESSRRAATAMVTPPPPNAA